VTTPSGGVDLEERVEELPDSCLALGREATRRPTGLVDAVPCVHDDHRAEPGSGQPHYGRVRTLGTEPNKMLEALRP
jgi:hypothetical protein